MRLSWDQYFIGIAFVSSLRATCIQAKHGCILVKDNQIISSGYNGSPSGEPHCIDEGCKMILNHCLRCRHAEVNAIIQAIHKQMSLKGATAYITGTPCTGCAKSLTREGIAKVVYERPYGKSDAVAIFKEAGIDFYQVSLDANMLIEKLSEVEPIESRVN